MLPRKRSIEPLYQGWYLGQKTTAKFQVYRDLDRPGLSAFSIGADGIAWLAACRRSFFLYRKRGVVLMQPDLFDVPELQVST